MTPYQLHVAKWRVCERCHLHEGRRRVVFARGKLPCDVLFIGEAPGESEDVLGSPFVGPAGQLLDQIIDLSVPTTLRLGFTNLVGCLPREMATGDKMGEPPLDAIRKCAPKLFELVRIARPRLIVNVGTLAKKHVIGQAQFCEPDEDQPPWISEGQFMRFCDIVHPAFILRAPHVQQGLAVQRCVVTLTSAMEEL